MSNLLRKFVSTAVLSAMILFSLVGGAMTALAVPPPNTTNASAALSLIGGNINYSISQGYLMDSYTERVCDYGSSCDIYEETEAGEVSFVLFIWSSGSCMQKTGETPYNCEPVSVINLQTSTSTYTPSSSNSNNVTYQNYDAVQTSGTVPYSEGQTVEVIAYQIIKYTTQGQSGSQPYYSVNYKVLANYYEPVSPANFSCTINSGAVTLDGGEVRTSSITTTLKDGYSGSVSYTSRVAATGFVPSSAPQVAFTGSSSYPPSPTAFRITTTASTTAGTYDVTFTGTDTNSKIGTCKLSLTINPSTPSFNLTVQPGTSPNGLDNTNPNTTINSTSSVKFDVFAECTGGFSGPVSGLTAFVDYQGVVTSLESTTLSCGNSTQLYLTNLASIPENMLADPGYLPLFLKSITVRGSGIIN